MLSKTSRVISSKARQPLGRRPKGKAISQSALAEFLREIPRPDAKLATQTYVFVKQLQWLVNEIADLESMKLGVALRINCKEVDEFALTKLERLLEILDPD